MKLVGPLPRPRTPGECGRVITFIRSDISGAALDRHHVMIETYCAAHSFTVVESITASEDRWPSPAPVLRGLVVRHGVDAVIVPGGDHLGGGLEVVAAVALVIAVDSRLMWLPGGLAVALS